jgi:hypothetical protein
MPSQRESNAATQDERAGNDYHEPEEEEEERDDSAEHERRKEQPRRGSGEAAHRMLRRGCEAPPAPRTGNRAPLFDSRAVGDQRCGLGRADVCVHPQASLRIAFARRGLADAAA